MHSAMASYSWNVQSFKGKYWMSSFDLTIAKKKLLCKSLLMIMLQLELNLYTDIFTNNNTIIFSWPEIIFSFYKNTCEYTHSPIHKLYISFDDCHFSLICWVFIPVSCISVFPLASSVFDRSREEDSVSSSEDGTSRLPKTIHSCLLILRA